MKKLIFGAAFICSIQPSISFAVEGISYDLIEIGREAGYGDASVASTYVRGAVSVTDNVFLTAGHAVTDAFSPQLTSNAIGVGGNFDTSDDSSMYVRYASGHVSGTGVSLNANEIEIGIRTKITEDFELNGSYSAVDFSGAVSGWSVVGYAYGPAIGVVYDINDLFAITAGLDALGGEASTSLGLRANF